MYFKILNEQTACTLGKRKDDNRSNESNGLPEINFLSWGGSRKRGLNLLQS